MVTEVISFSGGDKYSIVFIKLGALCHMCLCFVKYFSYQISKFSLVLFISFSLVFSLPPSPMAIVTVSFMLCFSLINSNSEVTFSMVLRVFFLLAVALSACSEFGEETTIIFCKSPNNFCGLSLDKTDDVIQNRTMVTRRYPPSDLILFQRRENQETSKRSYNLSRKNQKRLAEASDGKIKY